MMDFINTAISRNIGIQNIFSFDAGCRTTVLHPGYTKKKGQDERNHPTLGASFRSRF